MGFHPFLHYIFTGFINFLIGNEIFIPRERTDCFMVFS